MPRITLLHRDAKHELDVDAELGVELLRMQIYSLTEVPPDEQQITGLGPGLLTDTADLSQIADGTWAILAQPAAAPAALPPARPSPAIAPLRPHREWSDKTAPMEQRLRSGFETSRLHGDAEQMRIARETVPWRMLTRAARASRDGRPGLQKVAEAEWPASDLPEAAALNDEFELRELIWWFKNKFFAWVDKPACEATGGPTEMVGMAPATPEEEAGGASRVEVYKGPEGHLTRFPRYNVPAVLLRTRRGRCGEWANAFALCCTAVGFDTRWVLDVTDHVWTEVHLEQRADGRPGGWVHADPCECVIDSPLMYEKGWGKKLSYVFSFGKHDVTDVAPRYSACWEQTLQRRTDVKEGWLELTIASINETRLAALSPAQREASAERRAAEQAALHEMCTPAAPAGAAEASEAAAPAQAAAAASASAAAGADSSGGSGAAEAKEAEQRGRQTGSLEWRQARGELGPGTDAATPPPAKKD